MVRHISGFSAMPPNLALNRTGPVPAFLLVHIGAARRLA